MKEFNPEETFRELRDYEKLSKGYLRTPDCFIMGKCDLSKIEITESPNAEIISSWKGYCSECGREYISYDGEDWKPIKTFSEHFKSIIKVFRDDWKFGV